MFFSREVGHDCPTSLSKKLTVMTYTNIRYSVMLNDAQYDYLLDESQEIDRMMCFRTFLKMTVMEKTKVEIKGLSADLYPGQFMASKVELSKEWRCNRKTATRIVKEFNQMDFLHSEPSNRTTIHTLKCLSVWVTDQGDVENPFFVSNPIVKPIGKQDKDVHVPPVAEREPTESDNATPLAPAATSPSVNGSNSDGIYSFDSAEMSQDDNIPPTS